MAFNECQINLLMGLIMYIDTDISLSVDALYDVDSQSEGLLNVS